MVSCGERQGSAAPSLSSAPGMVQVGSTRRSPFPPLPKPLCPALLNHKVLSGMSGTDAALRSGRSSWNTFFFFFFYSPHRLSLWTFTFMQVPMEHICPNAIIPFLPHEVHRLSFLIPRETLLKI